MTLIIKEHGCYPLFCKCYSCGRVISFQEMIPNEVTSENYILNKIKDNILMFLL